MSNDNNNITIALAVSTYCPVCSKESKKRCSRCKGVAYCSQECQSSHWSIHKTESASLVAEPKVKMPNKTKTQEMRAEMEEALKNWHMLVRMGKMRIYAKPHPKGTISQDAMAYALHGWGEGWRVGEFGSRWKDVGKYRIAFYSKRYNKDANLDTEYLVMGYLHDDFDD